MTGSAAILAGAKEELAVAVVKTAISIERELFDAGEELAREWNISRSDLYARALRKLVRAQRRQDIRDRINAVEAALTDDERADERAITEGLRRATRDTLGVEPW